MRPDDLKKSIHVLFEDSFIRLTPQDLERMVCRSHPEASPRAVRSAIKEMVTDGSLFYSNHFNTTHLELNFRRPVKVSPRIVLMPHGQTCQPEADETQVIMMFPGNAFGIGDHPTTRLALRAVDNAMTRIAAGAAHGPVRALDIGTGSGVLAMAAVRLGAEKVVAVDIDPVALYEARNNILLNGLDQEIRITDHPIENLSEVPFDLVMANLRPPTLRQIIPKIETLSSKDCHWIISGFRREAMGEVARILPQEKIELLSKETACGWAAMTVLYHCRS